MSKVSYKSILKETISEFDTSKMVDAKGPMLEPILSYTGDGELPTNKDAASVLERYYFHEKEARSVTIPDTGEGVDIEQPPTDDLKDAPKVKSAIADELKGKDGSLEKVVESDEEEIVSEGESIEDRLSNLEESFLLEMEEDALAEETKAKELAEATGPGGHEADGTGPHGAGKGPGKGKADGSGMEAEGSDEEKGEEVAEPVEESFEDRLFALEAEAAAEVEEDKEPSEELIDKETESTEASEKVPEEVKEDNEIEISDIENTVLEALIDEMDEEDTTKKPDDGAGVVEEEPAGDAGKEKGVLDVDAEIKKVSEGDGLGPIGTTSEDTEEDIQEMLAMLEADIDSDENLDDIKVENEDPKNIKV